MNPEARKAAIRYWERRRMLYNLLLLPPAATIYWLRVVVSAGVGDTRYLDGYQVALLFLAAGVGANVCYSFVYALEFLLGSENGASPWERFGRTLVFVVGTVFAVFLAIGVARDIGGAEYTPTWLSQK
jgi:hypothetical protein